MRPSFQCEVRWLGVCPCVVRIAEVDRRRLVSKKLAVGYLVRGAYLKKTIPKRMALQVNGDLV